MRGGIPEQNTRCELFTNAFYLKHGLKQASRDGLEARGLNIKVRDAILALRASGLSPHGSRLMFRLVELAGIEPATS